MGPSEQNQHSAELRQKLKVCLYIHISVLQRGLPRLDGKLKRFVTKKWKKRLPNSSQTDGRRFHRVSNPDRAPLKEVQGGQYE